MRPYFDVTLDCGLFYDLLPGTQMHVLDQIDGGFQRSNLSVVAEEIQVARASGWHSVRSARIQEAETSDLVCAQSVGNAEDKRSGWEWTVGLSASV